MQQNSSYRGESKDDDSASDEDLLDSGLYLDFPSRGKKETPSSVPTGNTDKNNNWDNSNVGVDSNNVTGTEEGSRGGAFRRGSYNFFKLLGGGVLPGSASLKEELGESKNSTPVQKEMKSMSSPSDAMDVSSTPTSTAVGSSSGSGGKVKSTKPRRRRGSHMMPEGMGGPRMAQPVAGSQTNPEPMETESTPTAVSMKPSTYRMPRAVPPVGDNGASGTATTTATVATTTTATTATTTKVKSTKPRRRRGSHMMPEGGAPVVTAKPGTSGPVNVGAQATTVATAASPVNNTTTATTTTATTTKTKSTKPRRRRGSHAMPEGGQGMKMPTSAELMQQKAAAAGASSTQAVTTSSGTPSVPAATSTTNATTVKVKSNKPRRRRGSHMMPEGGMAGGSHAAPPPQDIPGTAPSQEGAAPVAVSTRVGGTAHRAKYVPPASSQDDGGDTNMDDADSSPPVATTVKVKSKKPGRRRGSHMMPEGQMKNLAVSSQVATAPAPPTPMDVSDEADGVIRSGNTNHMRRESNEVMAEPEEGIEVTVQTHRMAPAPQTQAELYPDPNTSDSSAPSSKPHGHTRARRRGSVVKTMLGGEKNVDGDGERYAQASATPFSQNDTGGESSGGDMMAVDNALLPQRRASQGADEADTTNKKPMLKQAHERSPGGPSIERGTSGAEGEGKRVVRKKDIGRKAIRSMAGELDYVHKVVPKSNDAKELIYDAIKPNILFRACSPEELVDLVDAFEPQYVPKGSIVIQEGDEGDHFYVMERGGVDVFEKDVHKCSLYSGVAFGEIALLYGCPRSATVQAKYDCKLWVIDRRAFRGITAQHKRKRLDLKLNFLKKVKIHDKVLGEILQPHEIHSMALATKTEKFRNGSAIVRQGEHGDAFYMIEEGTVDVFIAEKGDRPVVTLKSGQFFGEKALLSSDVRTATCLASSDVKCMLLMREDFVLMLGNLQDLLDRSYIARDEALRAEQEAMRLKETHSVTQRFDMNDFDIKRTLGVGAFGFVKLVKWNHAPMGHADDYYALKCVSKQKIEEHKQQEKIKNEESIMKELVHPFIARCYSVMEDEKGKYFLMEALCGGELCELLYHESQFSEGWSMFYSASVLTAFAHMHERKIAYRDLKPENLVLNTAGFVKIVDFGLAKKITSGQTYTFCGTPDYLAPEVILNEGYDWAVDYWGLGVLIYEMTAGVAPFFAESPMETYEKVLSGHVYIPGHFSRALANLIKKLLHTSQSKRLGRTVGGATTVMCHPWYSGFDWDALMEYRLRVPYIPEEKDPDDNSAAMEESEAEGFATAFF